MKKYWMSPNPWWLLLLMGVYAISLLGFVSLTGWLRWVSGTVAIITFLFVAFQLVLSIHYDLKDARGE